MLLLIFSCLISGQPNVLTQLSSATGLCATAAPARFIHHQISRQAVDMFKPETCFEGQFDSFWYIKVSLQGSSNQQSAKNDFKKIFYARLHYRIRQ